LIYFEKPDKIQSIPIIQMIKNRPVYNSYDGPPIIVEQALTPPIMIGSETEPDSCDIVRKE
jgi:hypothetical protein